MDTVFCGLDFGTTNSSVALSDGKSVQTLALDPLNDPATSLPSLLYISREGEEIVGRAAASAFIERNVGREVLVRQVDLGVDIEGHVASEPDKSASYRPREEGGEPREAVRARARVEVNSPGRLFQSLKSSLRYNEFKGTDVFGRHYQIEALVATVLARLKHAAETASGQPVEKAVFGRPVRFSTSDEEDALAEHRLRTAASLAGFHDVTFFYEPVAACVEYAVTGERRQRLLVVDIGGGTCDVCVMEFGSAQGAEARLTESRILGVAGVPVAGDVIDREIIRAKVFPRLGSRCRYGPSQLPMPQHLYESVLDWQNLYQLNTEETINWLIAAQASSTDPEGIRALRGLVQGNYGYPLVRAVEAAKKRLSFEQQTTIAFDRPPVAIREDLERAEFSHLIEAALEKMLGSIREAERAAQVRPEEIDCALTTGGTSLIPAVRHMLADRYGEHRLLRRETFTSVATGLAVVAQFV